jgi:hypothetical protein
MTGTNAMPDFQAIASQRPQNLDEALVCMQKAMDFYHAHNDYRAVFLRAYYITTVEVHADLCKFCWTDNARVLKRAEGEMPPIASGKIVRPSFLGALQKAVVRLI